MWTQATTWHRSRQQKNWIKSNLWQGSPGCSETASPNTAALPRQVSAHWWFTIPSSPPRTEWTQGCCRLPPCGLNYNSLSRLKLVVQLLVQFSCCVQLFATPWNAACQASLSTRSVMPTNHLIPITKAERWRIDAFKLWCWRRLLRVSWITRRANQSILKEISSEYSWKDWCWLWRSIALATWWEELTHLKRPWCWEILKAGGEGNDRRQDGWMASLTQWPWILASSGSRW